MAGGNRSQVCFFAKDGVMANVTLEVDLPEGVVVSSYERVGDGAYDTRHRVEVQSRGKTELN